MTSTPPATVARPAPPKGWIQTTDKMQQHRNHRMPVLVNERPTSDTVARADIGYPMNYGARAVRNLRFGQAVSALAPGKTLDQWIADAKQRTAGENPAVAIVREGANLVYRSVMQPATWHADEATTRGWVPFRPGETTQEYDDTFGDRVLRTTHAVQLLDPSIQAIVDDKVVFDSRAPKLVAVSDGPIKLGGTGTTVVLKPPVDDPS